MGVWTLIKHTYVRRLGSIAVSSIKCKCNSALGYMGKIATTWMWLMDNHAIIAGIIMGYTLLMGLRTISLTVNSLRFSACNWWIGIPPKTENKSFKIETYIGFSTVRMRREKGIVMVSRIQPFGIYLLPSSGTVTYWTTNFTKYSVTTRSTRKI